MSGRPELPAGEYLTCTHDIRPEHGGTTRALLLRNRLFAEECGIRPRVLLFAPAADLDSRLDPFREAGLVTDAVQVLNIYDHYRERGWGNAAPSGRRLDDLSPHKVREEERPDGTPWRRSYKVAGRLVHDYLRPDGTAFLRIPAYSYDDADSWPRAIRRISEQGEELGAFRGLGAWFRGWIRDLTEDDQRVFVFVDSRQLVPHLVAQPDPGMHLMYTLHNNHLLAPWRWDSPTPPAYERVLDRADSLDAMVLLTERQRDDVGRRRGDTSNLFVVPNPVALPPGTAHGPRDPHLVVAVARLERQKRLDDAIRAFELVLKKVPGARFHIYGSGNQERALQREIDRRGLGQSVTLKGFDPRAREALREASAFVLTSAWEGYPLATLEALAHGCPVVAYDIPYGPREQVTDGVDGYLVEPEDVEQLADRLVRLLTHPERVLAMSGAARDKAAEHGSGRFLSDWAAVLQSVVEQAPRRTVLREMRFETQRLQVSGPRLAGRHGIAPAGTYSRERVLRLTGVLHVRGRGKAGLGDARVELRAIHQTSGAIVMLPVDVRVGRKRIRVSTQVRLDDVYPAETNHSESTRLVVRLVWRNSAADAVVTRPPPRGSRIELGYDSDDALVLRRLS